MLDSDYSESDSLHRSIKQKMLERERKQAQRENYSLAVGEIQHKRGKHPYLNIAEQLELVNALLEWPSVEAAPKLKEIPTLISSFFCCCSRSISHLLGLEN
jgi:hypothetical protein